MPQLTEKQKRFCEEYLIDLNATQSAIRAGYKNGEIGRQLITKNNVLQYIQKLRTEQSMRTEVTADRVVAELERIAFAETEITEKSKIKALEMLGKRVGIFDEKSQSAEMVVTIVDDIKVD